MLETLKKQDYTQVYEILRHSFPITERRTREGQEALLRDPTYEIRVCKKEEDVKAFIAFWKLEGFVFVEHFAVSEKYRNEGLGRKMLAALQEEQELPLCLEVEPPDEEMARRRIGFYERQNFCLNAHEYEQPPLRTENLPMKLLLMTYPAPIDRAVFEHYRKQMYKKAYKCEK